MRKDNIFLRTIKKSFLYCTFQLFSLMKLILNIVFTKMIARIRTHKIEIDSILLIKI